MDEFAQAQAQRRPGYAGWWEKVLPLLTDEQRHALDAALANPEIGHTAISTVLRRWGHDVSYQQVGHYRRRHVR